MRTRSGGVEVTTKVAGGWLFVALAVAVAAVSTGSTHPTATELTTSNVIVVSVDGLRPSVITELGPEALPNLFRMRSEGAFTDNARTDVDLTVTLPNHTAMLTGRFASGDGGHGVTFNTDLGGAIHGLNQAVPYVASVFDVVHDAGRSTALYASKSKFELFDRTWDGANGAVDVTGTDDGRDKIDAFVLEEDTAKLISRFETDIGNMASPYAYSLVHIADPDQAGHAEGWESETYLDAVRRVDGELGRLMELVEAPQGLPADTVIIVLSDHGGSGNGHADSASRTHYTIPLYVWGSGVAVGDLFELNEQYYRDPRSRQPGVGGTRPPIRSGDAANLALDLLGLPPVPGSTLNRTQNLKVGEPDAAVDAGDSPQRPVAGAGGRS